MKLYKKITVWMLGMLCIFFLMPTVQVHAANATGTVKNRILNVRSKATTGSSIVCKLSKGTKMTISSETTGTDGMKWYSITVSDNGTSRTGYVRSDLVTVSGTVTGSNSTSSTATTTAAVATGSLDNIEYLNINVSSARVRESASTSSAIVATLSRGTTVKQKSSKVGTDGKTWIKVSFTWNGEKKYGYIRSDLLTAMTGSVSSASTTSSVTASATTTTVNSAENASEGDTLYVSATAVRVREKASTSSTIIANLLQGDSVKQKKIKTGDDGKKWTKVSFTINSVKYEGYIRTDYLTTTGTSSSASSSNSDDSEYRYVSATAVRVREHASDSDKIIANLLQGDKVKKKATKTGADGKEWTRVTFEINGTKYSGYIRSDYLSKTKP
jgi:uncharacterized protein YgiM (DUF1202 family)